MYTCQKSVIFATMYKFAAASCVGSVTFVCACNSTEHWRMARNIQRGKMFLPVKEHLDPALCQFPLADVRNAVNRAPDSFCGLVGLKATGKTNTLELVAKEQPNVVYVKMKASDDVCDALYERMKKATYHLPWPLDRIRFNPSLTTEAVVEKVFRYVRKSSGTKVTTVTDIEAEPPSIQSHLTFLFDPNARSFIRQVKQLVDSAVMRCIFAASEGDSFQAEQVREPRLELFMAYELPIPAAEKKSTD